MSGKDENGFRECVIVKEVREEGYFVCDGRICIWIEVIRLLFEYCR